MKKILIITTGGTIASEKTSDGLKPAHKGNELIDGEYMCGIEISDLFSRDSTDITPMDCMEICRAVRNSKGYDGVVVLHGTDTLEYTAAALALTCSDLNKPVIITGSMLPFGAENGDGKRNISDSIKAACDERLKGVFTVFSGRIISGGDTVKRDSLDTDAFRSFSGRQIGRISDNEIFVDYEILPLPLYPIPEKSGVKIAVIKLSPFTEEITVPEGYSGAVIESFGAGGVPCKPEIISSLKKLCKRMEAVMTTACTHGADLNAYEVGRRALDCGVTDGKQRSTACAAAELFLKNSQSL